MVKSCKEQRHMFRSDVCTHLQDFVYIFVVTHFYVAIMFALSLIASCDWQLFMALWPCSKNPHPFTHHGNIANLTKSAYNVQQGVSSALSSSPEHTTETIQCRDKEAEISHDCNYVVERMFQTWCFLVICAFAFISPHSRECPCLHSMCVH